MRTWTILGIFAPVLGADRKEKFWDGPCKAKHEAKRDEFKKEVRCEGNY